MENYQNHKHKVYIEEMKIEPSEFEENEFDYRVWHKNSLVAECLTENQAIRLFWDIISDEDGDEGREKEYLKTF